MLLRWITFKFYQIHFYFLPDFLHLKQNYKKTKVLSLQCQHWLEAPALHHCTASLKLILSWAEVMTQRGAIHSVTRVWDDNMEEDCEWHWSEDVVLQTHTRAHTRPTQKRVWTRQQPASECCLSLGSWSISWTLSRSVKVKQAVTVDSVFQGTALKPSKAEEAQTHPSELGLDLGQHLEHRVGWLTLHLHQLVQLLGDLDPVDLQGETLSCHPACGGAMVECGGGRSASELLTVNTLSGSPRARMLVSWMCLSTIQASSCLPVWREPNDRMSKNKEFSPFLSTYL